MSTGFAVTAVDFQQVRPELHAIREQVFIVERGVPVEIERDALDPLCHHVIARDTQGQAIGTGRLTPDRRLGRMAVLQDWRGRGVGEAILVALLDQARELGWEELELHAQVPAMVFYARHGFLPVGARFMEAGLEHQTMRRLLDAANPVDDREGALAALLGVLHGAARSVSVYTRELDPGLFDRSEALAALRRLATAGGEVRVLLQDPGTPQRALAPLIGLGQRLPSAFAFRAVDDPVDRGYASAFVVNDRGGWYFRPLGHRFEGETRIDFAPRARQLLAQFDPVWERSRPCTEFRALGI